MINIEIIKVYNNISKELLNMNIDQLNKGIWILLTNFKSPNLDLTSKGFKQFFTVRILTLFASNIQLLKDAAIQTVLKL